MSDEPEDKKPNIDMRALEHHLEEWDRIQEQRESALGAYRNECAGFKEREKKLKTIIKNAGMGARAFGVVLKQRKLLAQLEALRADEDMKEEDIQTADMLLEAIGSDFASFGLGGAALNAAKEREKAQSDKVDSITDEEWNKIGEENAAKVAKGIKQLEPADDAA